MAFLRKYQETSTAVLLGIVVAAQLVAGLQKDLKKLRV